MLNVRGYRIVEASRVSEAVPERLTRSGGDRGHVQGLFRSAVNVSGPLGLVTIVPSAAEGLPNGIQVDLGPDLRTIGLQTGMQVHATDRGLDVPAARLHIQWSTAPRWSPRLPIADDGPGRAAQRWRGRTRATWALSDRLGADRGFGRLLDTERGAQDVDPPTIAHARAALATIASALASGNCRCAETAARSLIGLGEGLTPSGDDALTGIEAALHALNHPMAGFMAPTLVDIDQRTTTVAAALLGHAASGEFAEGLHLLLGDLLGADDGRIAAALERAVAWGATSGTDCLVGVLVGLDVAAERPAGFV